MPARRTLESIVDQLDRHHQRATHGAVASHLGRVARSLMQGKAPSRRYSWIVAKKTGEPTGYPPEQVHPALKERSRVLATQQELEAWLEEIDPVDQSGGDTADEEENGEGNGEGGGAGAPMAAKSDLSGSSSAGAGTMDRARGGWAAIMRIVAFVAGAWRFVTGR